jgi:hypothetical protein
MIHTIQEITELPMIVVLYRAGASGEFLSHAITQSFDSITKTAQFWENNNRCKYFDLFDRNLNSGFDCVDHNELIRGVNLYLDQNKPTNTTHIAVSHPRDCNIAFLQEHLISTPIIEIATNNPVSKKFIANAAKTKINQHQIDLKNLNRQPGQIADKFPNHLVIEWEDFILNKTESVFYKISDFIQKSGSVDTFCDCVADYKKRNANLLQTLVGNES